MKSETLGADILEVEVTQISKHGIWLLLTNREFFLSFQDFPWFKNSPVSAIHNVNLLSADHLYWPDLDIDLAVESIEHPERFPLVAMAKPIVFGVGFALPNGVDVRALKRSLVVEGSEIQTYGRAPSSPGVAHGGALDLALVLGAAGSVASLASLLWSAYEKFIAPKKTSQKDDNAGINIVISRPDGTVEKFLIGNTEREREVFVSKFSKMITEIRNADDPSFWREAVAEIEETGIWIRQKR